MILLLGGTSETAPLASALVAEGWHTVVSTATDVSLSLPVNPFLERRTGRLDLVGMINLIKMQDIRLLLDATHPFATDAHTTAQAAAKAAEIQYLRWQRPGLAYKCAAITEVKTHEEAAKQAISSGQPILLTTGSRHLAPYVQASIAKGIPLFARVLPHPESREACSKAGLSPDSVIMARGPFSVQETADLIKRYNIGVLVTKDSGAAGGLPEKLEAATRTGCRVVMIRQPEIEDGAECFNTVEDLLDAVRAALESA